MLHLQKPLDDSDVKEAQDKLNFWSEEFQKHWPKLLIGAGQIVLILVVALVVRYLVHRAIDRVTRGDGTSLPTILKPLRERAPESLGGLISERRMQRSRTIGSVLKSVTSMFTYGLAFVLILSVLGFDIGPILASAGVLGVALGFGAQNLVKDFLSGMFMIMEDQYGVGDIVDLGPASGTVEAVGMRVTTIRDINGTVWYVRNGEILRVGNSSQGFAVAVVDLPLSHQVDVEHAIRVMGATMDTAVAEPPLSDDVIAPPEMLGVDKITAEAIVLRATVKVRPGRQWAAQRGLRAKIKMAFDEANIELSTIALPSVK
ncbi:mechanosensitive ion channel family protein [Pseudonocardiaceae bacterium YIM PH 21723]|nr:mechanosensitive ion channel family protein [Pseudonocardiaceae bacterium YIM PH 21723]